MADIVSLNRFLNLVDPPKDLAVASTDSSKSLSNDRHHDQIQKAIYNLFGTGEIKTTDKFLKENGVNKYKAVGDDKDKLSNRIRTVYKYYFDDQRDMIQVLINGGSPTGYYPLPQGYNIIQDNYGGKCTTNPNYIITPASLIDPCSRKHNEGNLDEGETFEEVMNYRLDKVVLDNAALDGCIGGPITCEDAGENWRVTIPLMNRGPLQLEFNKETHKEQETDYTSGNPHKNQKIFELLSAKSPNLSEVQLYILVKELGDLLQVLWVNALISNDNKKFTSANTIVCTSDSVVLYRCIINGIGCIFKESKAKNATYYLPNIEDNTTKVFMQQQTITMIKNEVNTNNIAMIELMEDALNTDVIDGKWVGETDQWKSDSVANAKAFLVKYIEELKNINADLMVKFNIITDLAVITELAAKSKFQPPFKKTKNGFGLLINVTYLFPKDKSRPFRAALFTPISFSKNVYPNPAFQRGGAPLMTFDRTILILLAVILTILVTGRIFRPELFLQLSALIVPRQRQVLNAIGAALGITEGVARIFDRGPGAIQPLYNGILAAGRVIESALPRPACSLSRPADPTRLSIITKTETILDNLQYGRDPGNEIVRKVILATGDTQQAINTLTKYIRLLQEAEGCLIQTEAYKSDREFLFYYAEEAANKMVEAASTISLFGDFLGMGRVETKVGIFSARKSPAKPLGNGFVSPPRNSRKKLEYSAEGGARHPILDYPGNMDKPGFLFCYAREMHQELFTYGYYMRLGFGASIEDSICNQYLVEEGDYEFMKDSEFVLHAELKNADELLEKTRELLSYAQVFLEEYPQMIKGESVSNFFEHLDLPKPDVTPLALQAAMDFYSAYYNIESMATYQKKDHKEYLLERLELLGHYEMLIEQDPKNELYKFESNYFYREAMSIASVNNAFGKIQEAIFTPSPVKIKKSPMAIAAQGGTRKVNKKKGRKTRSRK